jgi:hypothetical protein
MTLCDFRCQADANGYLCRCVICGREVSARRLPVRAACGLIRLPRVAVGDLVERMLTGIGISKARVQQWLRVKDCGCAKRQRWLNQWGYKQQDRIERLLNRAARWYGIG